MELNKPGANTLKECSDLTLVRALVKSYKNCDTPLVQCKILERELSPLVEKIPMSKTFTKNNWTCKLKPGLSSFLKEEKILN